MGIYITCGTITKIREIMKKLLLAASLLLPFSTFCAKKTKGYSLGYDSKKNIAFVSVMGAGIGFIASCLMNNYSEPQFNARDLVISGTGALIMGLTAYHNSPEKRKEYREKEFAQNLEKYREQASDLWKELEKDAVLEKLLFLKKKEILNLEWYLPKYRDSLYDAYPLISAYNFLLSKRKICKELEKLSDYIYEGLGGVECLFNHNRYEKFCDYLAALEEAIKVIENSKEYQKQYKHYKDSLPKPMPHPVPPAPVVVHHPMYHAPVVAHHPAPKPKPIYKPKPVAVKPIAKQNTTISPVLEGDVYGTIWSNY